MGADWPKTVNAPLTAIPSEYEDADGRGKADVGCPRLDHLDCQLVQRQSAFGGDIAEGLPELGFEADAGAVAAQGDGVFDGTGGHSRSCPSSFARACSARAFCRSRSARVRPCFAAFSSAFWRAAARAASLRF